jgi:hypothetical protein
LAETHIEDAGLAFVPAGPVGHFASCRRERSGGAKIPLSPVDLEEDGMARKTSDADVENERKPRGKRRLAMLLALAGGAFYLMRRSQRRAKIEEGVWHEAPSA